MTWDVKDAIHGVGVRLSSLGFVTTWNVNARRTRACHGPGRGASGRKVKAHRSL